MSETLPLFNTAADFVHYLYQSSTRKILQSTRPTTGIGSGNVGVPVDSRVELDLKLHVVIVSDICWTLYSLLLDKVHGQYVGVCNTFLDAIDGSYCTYCAYGECGDAWFDPQYPDYHNGSRVDKSKLKCVEYQARHLCGSINWGIMWRFVWDICWPFWPFHLGVFKPTNVISISYGRSVFRV